MSTAPARPERSGSLSSAAARPCQLLGLRTALDGPSARSTLPRDSAGHVAQPGIYRLSLIYGLDDPATDTSTSVPLAGFRRSARQPLSCIAQQRQFDSVVRW